MIGGRPMRSCDLVRCCDSARAGVQCFELGGGLLQLRDNLAVAVPRAAQLIGFRRTDSLETATHRLVFGADALMTSFEPSHSARCSSDALIASPTRVLLERRRR